MPELLNLLKQQRVAADYIQREKNMIVQHGSCTARLRGPHIRRVGRTADLSMRVLPGVAAGGDRRRLSRSIPHDFSADANPEHAPSRHSGADVCLSSTHCATVAQ
jgi:hypothetical protein